MSEAGSQPRKRNKYQNPEHTEKVKSSETSKSSTNNDGKQVSSQNSQSSNQPLWRMREAERAHEEDTAGCWCPIAARLPHFHWSKKTEQRLAGDQFAYDIWHNPREELDERRKEKGCPDCKTLCDCSRVKRWWPGWGGN